MGSMDQTVLVVEDNDINMRLFHDVLEARGYNVLQAQDGTEGWHIAREHRLGPRSAATTVWRPSTRD